MASEKRPESGKTNETCDNLLHGLRLRNVEPHIHACVTCGEQVVIEVQIYPRWLTEVLSQKCLLDGDGEPIRGRYGPMPPCGVGYAEDRRGRNWERLEPTYRTFHPMYKDMRPNQEDEE